MGSKKRAAWSKAKSEFLGAATGGDMSDLFAREDERRDALDAAKTTGGVVWPATNANTAVDGT